MQKERKFNGKLYRLDTTWAYKRHAVERAKLLRKRGELARVVKSTKKIELGGRWYVYSR